MVTLELSVAARWVYVKASGFVDYWDDEIDMAHVIREVNRLGLGAILWDARNVSGELGPKKVTGDYCMLRQQLEGVRVAYVISEKLKLAAPIDYSMLAKSLGVPARSFGSLDEASRWLAEGIDDRAATTRRATGRIAFRRAAKRASYLCSGQDSTQAFYTTAARAQVS